MDSVQKKWLRKLFDAYPKYIPAPLRSAPILHGLILEGFVEADLTQKGIGLCLLASYGGGPDNAQEIIKEAIFRITPLGVKELKL